MRNTDDFCGFAEHSLDVEWVQGAMTPVSNPHSTGWRVLPFLVTAQLVNGRSLIELGDETHVLHDGAALCIKAGIRHRITILTSEIGHSLWSHVHLRVFGSIDLMTLIDTPVIIGGSHAAHIGTLNRQLAEQHSLSTPSLKNVIERRRMAFDLLATIAATSLPSQRLVKNLQELQRLTPILAFIEHNLAGEPLDLPQLARRAHLSPSRFSAVFREALGLAPSQYIQARRMIRAESLLISSDASVQDIAERSGFGDPFHFSRLFTKRHGISPRAYREQASTLLL